MLESGIETKTFTDKISNAIKSNNDDLLTEIIRNSLNLIQSIQDHKYFLNLAVSKKSTKTFALLIDYGFDPSKGGASTPNPVGFAVKTQGSEFLSLYCEAISKKFGKDLIISLINEKDANGKNAFRHALEGRSYLEAVKFLIKNGADISENFMHNAKFAIENRHVKTLELMLDNNGNVTSDQLLELSKHAQTHNNHICQNLFGSYAEKNTLTAAKIIIDTVIIAHKQDQGSSSDIFEICRQGSTQDLEFLFEVLESRSEKALINNNDYPLPAYDKYGKSALFYALSNNCYNPLVSRLLQEGAIITNLEKNKSSANNPVSQLDALTMCIQAKEPKTLATILNSPNLDMIRSKDKKLLLGHHLFDQIVKEMLSPQNLNAVVVESFFTNVPDDRLQNMKKDTLVNLIKESLKYAPEAAAEKLKKSFAQAVKDSSLKFVETLLYEFPISDLIATSEKKNPSGTNIQTGNEEKISLLQNASNNPSYGANDDSKMTDLNPQSLINSNQLFEIALQQVRISKENESARKILLMLLEKGIEVADKTKMAEDLANVGITEKDYKPNYSVICGKLCSTLSEALGFSSPKVR